MITSNHSNVSIQFEKELGPPKAYAPPYLTHTEEVRGDRGHSALIRVQETASNKIGPNATAADPPRPASSEWEDSGSSRMPAFSDTQRCLVVVGFFTAVITVLVIVIIADSVHTIEEGNVGIYYVQVSSGAQIEQT